MVSNKSGTTWTYLRLQLLYFLTFLNYGCFSYVLGTACQQHHILYGSLYSAFAFGALISFCVGPIVDRKIDAKKFFAVCQVLTAISFWFCWVFASRESVDADILFASDGLLSRPSCYWLGAMFFAGACFLSSLPICNTIVMAHVPRKEKAPLIFVAGTIGWCCVNWAIIALGDFGVKYFYILNGFIALILAGYSLTLPKTKPAGTDRDDPFGLKALTKAFKFCRRRDVAVFITCVSLCAIFGSGYYFPVCETCFPGKSTLNQISELLFMTALAWAVPKLGLKWTIFLGASAWAIRYYCFASGNDFLAAIGILSHGIAYAWLYSCSFLYCDKIAPKELKGSIQAIVSCALLGVAQIISGYAVDYMLTHFPNKSAVAKSVVVLNESDYAQDSSVYAQDSSIDKVVKLENESVEAVVANETTTDAETPDTLEASASGASPSHISQPTPSEENVGKESASKSNISFATWWDRKIWHKYNWRVIFGVPAVFCTIIAILFALLTKEPVAFEENSDKE